jgi:plastocyanin
MKKAAFLFALLLASFALVACGGDDDDSDTTTGGGETTQEGGTAGSASALVFEADPGGGLAYISDTATVKAGKVTVDFTNPQPISHDVAIEDSGGKTIAQTEVIGEGTDSTVANLKSGEYTFYCSVPGHREAGMEGTLTVK